MAYKVLHPRGPTVRFILVTLASLWASSFFILLSQDLNPDNHWMILPGNDENWNAISAAGEGIMGDKHVLQDVQAVNTTFYIYDDYFITQELLLEVLRLQGEAELYDYAYEDHVLNAVRAERATLQALEKHPLRTRDPDKAELYIIPTPISELFAYGCWDDDCKRYTQAFETLRRHDSFQRTRGHNHVLISYGWFSFTKMHAGYIPALSSNYKILENVTVASHYDPFGSLKLASRTALSQEKGFNYLFSQDRPVTNKAFSIGLGLDAPFDIQQPTFEKFHESEYFCFYHSNSSSKSFGYGSTRFRHSLVEDSQKEIMASFPHSSIGNDLDEEEWARHFTSSKFCLVIRGDTPHSHSFLYAVRAGCIPVIVSDYYQEYAGPFKSSLNMKDFCILVKEERFVNDTKSVIAKLHTLADDVIRSKLRSLAIAQSVILPDHPDSLFVEAFLKEATAANQRIGPHVATQDDVEIAQGTVVISGMVLKYRYPSQFSSRKRSRKDGPVIIVGVLASAAKAGGRNSVRNTWAQEYSDRVLFIVSGPWNKIKDEFFRYGDMLWIDMPEEYLLLTYKTQLFFHMVETHVESYDYAMKTDDDSYVGVQEVTRIIAKHQVDYWGYCLVDKEFRTVGRNTSYSWYTPEEMYPDELYPPYAQGLGFVLSRDFVRCIVRKIGNLPYLPWEDTSIGILAKQCGFSCQGDEFVFYGPNRPPGLTTVEHHVKTSDRMLKLHQDELKKKKLREWVDKPELIQDT